MFFTLQMRQLLRHVCNAGALITLLQAHDRSAQTCADTLSIEDSNEKNLLDRDGCKNIRDDVMHTNAVNKISKRKGPRFMALW